MRMKTVVAALLRELAKWLRLGARKPTPRANPTAPESMSEPMHAISDDTHSEPEHPLGKDIHGESLGERDEPSDEQPANGHPDDERPPAEPPSGTADPEQEHPLSSCDADDEVPPRSEGGLYRIVPKAVVTSSEAAVTCAPSLPEPGASERRPPSSFSLGGLRRFPPPGPPWALSDIIPFGRNRTRRVVHCRPTNRGGRGTLSTEDRQTSEKRQPEWQ